MPLASAASGGVAPVELGTASGLLNVSRQIGGAVGLAAVVTAVTAVAPQLAAGYRWGFAAAAAAALSAVAVALALTIAAPERRLPAGPRVDGHPGRERTPASSSGQPWMSRSEVRHSRSALAGSSAHAFTPCGCCTSVASFGTV